VLPSEVVVFGRIDVTAMRTLETLNARPALRRAVAGARCRGAAVTESCRGAFWPHTTELEALSRPRGETVYFADGSSRPGYINARRATRPR